MVNIGSLTGIINDLLVDMDTSLARAKAAMGIKPDLCAARTHVEEAHEACAQLAVLVLQAKAVGVLQPPDVLKRINSSHDECDDIMQEIMVCAAVQATGDSRPKPPVTGKNASN